MLARIGHLGCGQAPHSRLCSGACRLTGLGEPARLSSFSDIPRLDRLHLTNISLEAPWTFGAFRDLRSLAMRNCVLGEEAHLTDCSAEDLSFSMSPGVRRLRLSQMPNLKKLLLFNTNLKVLELAPSLLRLAPA